MKLAPVLSLILPVPYRENIHYDNSEFDCQVAIGLKASLSTRKK